VLAKKTQTFIDIVTTRPPAFVEGEHIVSGKLIQFPEAPVALLVTQVDTNHPVVVLQHMDTEIAV
jgi:hypothetical protein